MKNRSLETQIQYKLIEHLSSANQELHDEIEKGKLREEEIKTVLKEKEILLKEVNHRVKNNLQVIHSLLSVQISDSQLDSLKLSLKEVQDRIYSISLLHNIMHKSDGKDKISLKEYLKEVIEYTARKEILIKVDCVEINPFFERASSLGMIIHELVMNSEKHAFNQANTPHIYLSIEIEGDFLKIIYADNGNKINNVSDIKPGFGMHLIEILLESQKNSDLKYSLNNPGLKIEFNYDYL